MKDIQDLNIIILKNRIKLIKRCNMRLKDMMIRLKAKDISICENIISELEIIDDIIKEIDVIINETI